MAVGRRAEEAFGYDLVVQHAARRECPREWEWHTDRELDGWFTQLVDECSQARGRACVTWE